ncbi:MAG TPA: ATP synthase F1 subunit delta [Gaiellaceae bacterium]|nr:ATP synthase F1 subunit delta [Gaiellaceae bacterium]
MSVADRVYARALYDAALDRGRVKEAQAQLAAVADAIAAMPQLRSLIGNPQVDAPSKAAVLESAVDEPEEIVSNFLKLVAEKGRAGSIEGIRTELDRIVARAEGQLSVTLTTAYELSDEEAKDIVGRIEKASGRKVEAAREVDPGLIGGIVLQAGSLRADASVRGRLERMRVDLLTRR